MRSNDNIKIQPEGEVHLSDQDYKEYFFAEEIYDRRSLFGRELKGQAYTHTSRLDLLTTSKGAYVVKNIAANKELAETVIEMVHRIQLNSNIPIARLRSFPGYKNVINGCGICKNGFVHIVMEYFKNEEYCSKKYTYGKLRSIGACLGEIEKVLSSLVKEKEQILQIPLKQPLCRVVESSRYEDMELFFNRLSSDSSMSSTATVQLCKKYHVIFQRLHGYLKSKMQAWAELPKELVFFDLNISNAVFTETDGIEGIFDFDTFRIGPRILAIKNPILSVGQDARFLFDAGGLLEICKAYELHCSNSKLSDAELELIPSIFCGAFLDIMYDYFIGKWNLFKPINQNLIPYASKSLEYLDPLLTEFVGENEGNNFTMGVRNVSVDKKRQVVIENGRTLIYVAPTQTGKARGKLSMKVFYVFPVYFDNYSMNKIDQYVERESGREQFELKNEKVWGDLRSEERIALMRLGQGPAQLRYFSIDSISRSVKSNEDLSTIQHYSFGDNIYALLDGAPSEVGLEQLADMADDQTIRVSVAALATIVKNQRMLLISQDEAFEKTGVGRYIPLGGGLSFRGSAHADLKELDASDFEGTQMDMRFQLPKTKLEEFMAMLESGNLHKMESPKEALYRELREELTGQEDGASVFISEEFPALVS